MTFGGVLVVALGVAMDSTAVAAARGLAAPAVRLADALLVGVLFGAMQAFMPLAGWLLGSGIGPTIAAWDHWVACALLVGIGARMLWEARATRSSAEKPSDRPVPGEGFRPRTLLALAVATSVDAFAVGITLPMLGAPLLLSLVTIGLTTALLSGAAVFLGRRFGARLGRRLDALGGLLLIGLGVKILVSHLRG